MKQKLKLIFLFALSSITSFVYSQKINKAYEFPVKPGSIEWTRFQNQEEMISACQIPDDMLEGLTTEALAETCLSYPLYPQIMAFNNIQNGFDKLATKFNGFRELLNRMDAGTVLLEKYKSMTPSSYSKEWTSIKKGLFIYDYLFIEMLLAQEKIITNQNSTLRKETLKECLKKLDEKIIEKDLFGLVGLSHTSFVMTKILNLENDQDFQTLYNTDEKIKAFEKTASSIDLETLAKIKGLTIGYLNKK
jgi:hypothetical protein